MNPDFRDFSIRIKTDISSKEIRKEKYDKVRKVMGDGFIFLVEKNPVLI